MNVGFGPLLTKQSRLFLRWIAHQELRGIRTAQYSGDLRRLWPDCADVTIATRAEMPENGLVLIVFY